MHRKRSPSCGIGLAWLVVALAAALPRAHAQQDATAVQSPQRTAILEIPDLGRTPGGNAPSLGPAPGALSTQLDTANSTAGAGVVGGRRRTGRLPRGASRAGQSTRVATNALALPEPLPAPGSPRAGGVPVAAIESAAIDDEGPPEGITLDDAIERMMAANLDVRAIRLELTQADADVLTAGLRTNPLVYMDTQFIPYGSFSDQRPGGPTQYDVNITYPIDVSQKRQARTVVARMARSTLEAQFQDVVRRQIDNVYRAFVSLQSARLDMLTAQAAVRRREELLATLRLRQQPDAATADAIDHLALAVERSRSSLGDTVEAFEDAQEGLAVLLNLPPDDTPLVHPRGTLRDRVPPPPPIEELQSLALRCRPDVHAARLGVTRAGAEVKLQRANRFDDVYLFYDPITIQDNTPYGRSSARSWAIGLTFALPIYNRNQGNIAKAQSNVTQTKLELSSLERRVVAEVRLASREYERSREALEQIEQSVLARMSATLARKTEEFTAGRLSADDFEVSVDDAVEVAQSHRDAVVRHRRAMLDLNTAVGLRLLP
jgi:outer membrane protein, heavy metal efflux system